MTALLEHRMDQTVSVYAHSGYNSVGDAQYSTAATSYRARVEQVQRYVKGPDGRDVIATTRVFVGCSTSGAAPTVTVQSKLVLPDGTSPPILSVDTHRKLTGGTDHQSVWCG